MDGWPDPTMVLFLRWWLLLLFAALLMVEHLVVAKGRHIHEFR